MRVGVATDHGGFSLKEDLAARLRAAGHEVVDFGAHELNDGDDYPDFVTPLARAVAAGTVERGVAVCGSGVGASVCASCSTKNGCAIGSIMYLPAGRPAAKLVFTAKPASDAVTGIIGRSRCERFTVPSFD